MEYLHNDIKKIWIFQISRVNIRINLINLKFEFLKFENRIRRIICDRGGGVKSSLIIHNKICILLTGG